MLIIDEFHGSNCNNGMYRFGNGSLLFV